MVLSLFPHNENAHQKLVDKLKDNQRVTINHATGTGKSFIVLKYMYENKDKRILYLTPTYPIFNQLIGPHMQDLGINYNEFKCLDNIIYPNLLKMNMETLAQNYDVFVFDEYHRCGAKQWNEKVKELFSIIEDKYKDKRIIGLTATPTRYLDKGRDMNDELFQGVCASELLLSDDILDGLLPAPKYINLPINSLTEIKSLRKKINKKIQYSQDRKYYNAMLDDIEKKLQQETNLLSEAQVNLKKDEGKFVVFCGSISDIEKNKEFIKNQFEGKNINFYTVHSKQSKKQNEAQLDEFRNVRGGYNFVFVVDILNEGVHVKDIDGVFMMRKTTSPIIYFQQLGRLLSFSARNSNLVVWDLVDNLKNHKIIHKLYNEVITRSKASIEQDPVNKERYAKILENFKIIDKSTELLAALSKLDEELSSENIINIRLNRAISILIDSDYSNKFEFWQAKRDLEELYQYITKDDFIKLKNYKVTLPLEINVSIEKFEEMLGGFKNLYEFNLNVANRILTDLETFIINHNCLPSIFSQDVDERQLALDLKKYYQSFNQSSKARLKKMIKSFDNKDLIDEFEDIKSFNKIDNNLIASLILEKKIKPFNYIKMIDFTREISKVKKRVKRENNYLFEQQIYLDKLNDLKNEASFSNNLVKYINSLDSFGPNVLYVNEIDSFKKNNFKGIETCFISSSMKLSDVQTLINSSKKNDKQLLYIVDDLELIPLISSKIDNVFIYQNNDDNNWLELLVSISLNDYSVLNTHIIDSSFNKNSFNNISKTIDELRDGLLKNNDKMEEMFSLAKVLNQIKVLDKSLEYENELKNFLKTLSSKKSTSAMLDTAIYVLSNQEKYNKSDVSMAYRVLMKSYKYITIDHFRMLNNIPNALPPQLQLSEEDFIKMLAGFSCLNDKEKNFRNKVIEDMDRFIFENGRVPSILSKNRSEVLLTVSFLDLPSNSEKKRILEFMKTLKNLTIFEKALYGFDLSVKETMILFDKLLNSSDRFLTNKYVLRIVRRIRMHGNETINQYGEQLYSRIQKLDSNNVEKTLKPLTYEETKQAYERIIQIIDEQGALHTGTYEVQKIMKMYKEKFEEYGFDKKIEIYSKRKKADSNSREFNTIIDYIKNHNLLGFPSSFSSDPEELSFAKRIRRISKDLNEEQLRSLESYDLSESQLEMCGNDDDNFISSYHRRPITETTNDEEYLLALNYRRLSKRIPSEVNAKIKEIIKKYSFSNYLLDFEYDEKIKEFQKYQQLLISYILNNNILKSSFSEDVYEEKHLLDLEKRFRLMINNDYRRAINMAEIEVKTRIYNYMINYLSETKQIPSLHDNIEEIAMFNRYKMIYPMLTSLELNKIETLIKQAVIQELIRFITDNDGDYPTIYSDNQQEIILANLFIKYTSLLTVEEKQLIEHAKESCSEKQSRFFDDCLLFIQQNKRLPDLFSDDQYEKNLAIKFNRKKDFFNSNELVRLNDLLTKLNIDKSHTLIHSVD